MFSGDVQHGNSHVKQKLKVTHVFPSWFFFFYRLLFTIFCELRKMETEAERDGGARGGVLDNGGGVEEEKDICDSD